MIPSPIYLSMIPLLRRTGSDITVMYRFSTLTSAAGVIPSLSAVNSFMSQNKTVISRREPLASVSSGRSSNPATMRGSTYLPKVSRIRALTRSSPTMLLKDWVSEPISSREVTGTTVSSAPCSTAAVPSSRRRTGRTRPRGDEGGDSKAKQRRNGQQCHANRDDAPLVGARADNGSTREAAHLVAGGVDLAVEIVAQIVQFAEQFAGHRFVARLGGAEQFAEDPLVTPPFLLQVLDLVVQPGQRDVVVKIERIGDLSVDVSACIGDPFVAGLAGGWDLLAQLIEFRSVIPGFDDRQQQPTDIGRFFNRVNIGLGERDIGREIVLIDDRKLAVDGSRHPQTQQRRCRHQDQQPDRDAKDLQPDRKTHGAASERHSTGRREGPAGKVRRGL